MGKYSIELRHLLEDDFYDIFDFDYDFYTDDTNIKCNFERKFIQKYYFREIGFDTPQKFSWFLRAKLDELAPTYKELYRSQVESIGYNFLENKNYTETFESLITNKNLRTDELEKTINEINAIREGNKEKSEENSLNNNQTILNQTNTSEITKTINTTQTKDLTFINGGTVTKKHDITTTDDGTNKRTDNLREDVDNDTRTKESNIRDGVSNVNVENSKTNETLNENAINTLNTGTQTTEVDNTNSVTGTITDINDITNKEEGSVTDGGSISDLGSNTLSSNDTIINDTQNKREIEAEHKSDSEKSNNENGLNTIKDDGEVVERRTLNGKGNIGVVSASKLISEWRKIILDVDRQLINELNDLFMGLF